MTRRTSPSRASRLRPLSRPSPGAAAKTRVRSRGVAGLEEALLESRDHRVRRADADEAGGRHRVAWPNDGDRVLDRNNLAAVGHDRPRSVLSDAP